VTTQAIAARRVGTTRRRDAWWRAPAVTALGLTAFGIYSITVAAMGSHYLYTDGGARYLSPFYSPDLKSFGLDIAFTYAFFVVWVPLGFRLTCYYYRKAYYRSFFLMPPACAVSGRPTAGRYRGETRAPYVWLNVHRFFFYLATIVLGFLTYDTVRAFLFRDSHGTLEFGVGLGSLVMVANVVLLALFTFGCNSLRHLVGGRLDCFTCSASARARHRAWLGVSVLNRWHMQWAWISLAGVAFCDLYIRLAAAGVFTDPRIF
jgi:hypothetical protein